MSQLPDIPRLYTALAEWLACMVYVLALRRRDGARWNSSLQAWGLIVLACAILFFIPMMVSTALEVFFTISAALLARRIWLRTEF